MKRDGAAMATTSRDIFYNETSCNRDAFARGSGQKIIGFSIYGDAGSTLVVEKGYFQGIEENLKLLPQLYPGKCCP